MTGVARRTGWSIRSVRTGLELGVTAGGVALGGALGLGTLAYAASIGPLAQWMIPTFAVTVDPAITDPPQLVQDPAPA